MYFTESASPVSSYRSAEIAKNFDQNSANSESEGKNRAYNFIENASPVSSYPSAEIVMNFD